MLSLDQVHELTGRRLGVFDVACPICGPDRRSRLNRTRTVLRIWAIAYDFAGYACARCGVSGHARDQAGASTPDPATLARARAEAAERKRQADREGRQKAVALWRRSLPHPKTVVETYLRQVRKCHGCIPSTVRFLPARGDYPPSMVMPFAFAIEPEPGRLAVSEAIVRGIHLTRLRSDGSGKADEPSKIMLGPSLGAPLVVAPMNDLAGLALVEGIEDGLTIAESTGLGVWAAGSASRLPALSDAVPAYVGCTTVVADPDEAGRRHGSELHRRLVARGLNAELVTLRSPGLPRAPA